VTESGNWQLGFWEVLGLRTSTAFFSSLPDLLPVGATLCLEEGSMDRGLRLFLEEHAVPPGREIERGTTWPKSKLHHAPVLPELMAEVQDFADRLAEPEVCEHLFAYLGDDLLMEWYDAWTDPLKVSRSIPGANLAVLCRRLEVPYVPRPFTADEIRDAMPETHRRRYRVTGPDGVKGYLETTVLRADRKGAKLEYQDMDPEGKPLGEPNVGRSTWTELWSHATFAANATTISEVDLETPTGTFPCLLYTVFSQEADESKLHRFWFAKPLAGAPVEFESHRDGEFLFRHTLTELD
jgi:hypothetical protein